MSEEFDKEAEREKLREQFAAEEEEREQTRRMSELLLKGATMTNKHCDRCGDPIFRQNGREFCPSCQGGGQAAAQQQQQQQQQRQRQPAAEPDEGAEPADADAGGSDEAAGATPDRTTSPAAEDRGATPPTTPARDAGGRSRDAGERGREPTPADARRDDRTEATPTPPADAGEFDDAVAAVEETVRRFSAAAANTDDPERAREYLQTVREATETLAALRGR